MNQKYLEKKILHYRDYVQQIVWIKKSQYKEFSILRIYHRLQEQNLDYMSISLWYCLDNYKKLDVKRLNNIQALAHLDLVVHMFAAFEQALIDIAVSVNPEKYKFWWEYPTNKYSKIITDISEKTIEECNIRDFVDYRNWIHEYWITRDVSEINDISLFIRFKNADQCVKDLCMRYSLLETKSNQITYQESR